jgi:hypothetical protein
MGELTLKKEMCTALQLASLDATFCDRIFLNLLLIFSTIGSQKLGISWSSIVRPTIIITIPLFTSHKLIYPMAN